MFPPFSSPRLARDSRAGSAPDRRDRPARRHGVAPRAVLRMLPILALALVSHAPLASDAWPERTIHIVLGTPAGPGNDASTRNLVEGLRPLLGQPIIVENRPGADGIIAIRQVIAAAPDGYTLASALGSQIVINPIIYANPGYDPVRDLVPVSMIARQPLMLAVHPSVPATNLKELVEWTRANPGKVNYGAGTSTFHLASESLKRKTGADMQHIPFNGGAPTTQALLAGTVQVALLPSTSILAQAKSGALRPLAVAGPKRLSQLPDVPTFAESGVPDEVPVWNAIFAPAGTPRAVVERLHAAVVQALRDPAVRARFDANAEVIVGSTPEELAATIAQDSVKMRELVGAIGLVPK